MRRQRKTPLRTCIGCNRTGDKREFVRIVRTADGHVSVDPTGKAPGRGAYVCVDPACFENAARRRRIDAALRVRLLDDDIDRLARELREAVAAMTTTQEQGR